MEMFKDQVSVIFDKLKQDKMFSILLKLIPVIIIALVALYIFSTIKGAVTESELEDPLVEYDGKYSGEPIEGISADEVVSGEYYILHNDVLYPLQQYYDSNFELDNSDYEDLEGSSSDHLEAMLNDFADEIPTLYLANGDKLVYYDEDQIAECVRIERFKDEGTSVGIFGLTPNTYNNYYTLNLDQEENDMETHVIYTDSAANDLLSGILDQSEEKKRGQKKSDDLTYLTITKIGDKELTRDQISSVGIIKGLERGKEYSISIYNGTIYNDYVLPADTRYFSGMEAYASTNIKLSEDNLQEIILPEGLLDGYYCVEDFGFFRLSVKDTWVDSPEYFNERLLESYEQIVDLESLDPDEAAVATELPAIIYTNLYSEDDRINQYYPIDPSAFGYKNLTEDADYYQEDKEEVKVDPTEEDKSELIDSRTDETEDEGEGEDEGESKDEDEEGSKEPSEETSEETKTPDDEE